MPSVISRSVNLFLSLHACTLPWLRKLLITFPCKPGNLHFEERWEKLADLVRAKDIRLGSAFLSLNQPLGAWSWFASALRTEWLELSSSPLAIMFRTVSFFRSVFPSFTSSMLPNLWCKVKLFPEGLEVTYLWACTALTFSSSRVATTAAQTANVRNIDHVMPLLKYNALLSTKKHVSNWFSLVLFWQPQFWKAAVEHKWVSRRASHRSHNPNILQARSKQKS